jgi:hypothetical protein
VPVFDMAILGKHYFWERGGKPDCKGKEKVAKIRIL